MSGGEGRADDSTAPAPTGQPRAGARANFLLLSPKRSSRVKEPDQSSAVGIDMNGIFHSSTTPHFPLCLPFPSVQIPHASNSCGH